MHIPEHLKQAVRHFLEGEATPEEQVLVMEWIDNLSIEDEPLLYNGDGEEVKKRMLKQVLQQIETPVTPFYSFKKAWFQYAAAVIIVLATGAFFLFSSEKGDDIASIPFKPVQPVEVAPGKEGAVLTLGDGSTVLLDSLTNGVIANQTGARVILTNGLLAYDPSGKSDGEMAYNMMTTPKGRHFKLLLPDGTNVWMNAASSLKYPTVFKGNSRKVEVTGEVYFEVASNVKMPFRVKVNNQAEIEVLGTHFNVNAYEDEGVIKTTLLEGSVRVYASGTSVGQSKDVVRLKPGQQAQLAFQGAQTSGISPSAIIIANADTEKVMAWKNGFFNFENAPLEEVMRQLGRWYDMEIVYEKGIPDIHFVGEVSRNVSLEGLLKGLDRAGVHFRKEGKRLVVLP